MIGAYIQLATCQLVTTWTKKMRVKCKMKLQIKCKLVSWWFVQWERLNGNGGRECSGVTVTIFGTTEMSICGGTKDVCRHVSTPTLNGTEKECLRSVGKSDMYLEGETSSPLYRRALIITVFVRCGIWLGRLWDMCSVIPTRRSAPMWPCISSHV